jgi:hypothetical protein
MANIWNYLVPEKRKQIGLKNLNIVPVGMVTDFEEYNAFGIQQPKYAITFAQMRSIAEKNVWVESAIRRIVDFMGSLSWQVIPKDKYIEDFKNDDAMKISKAALEELFILQNATYRGLPEVIKAAVRDLLIMDAACIEIVRNQDPTSLTSGSNRRGRIVGLIARDAATVFIDHDEKGTIRRYVQAGMRGRTPAPVTEDNIIFNMDIGGTFAIFDPSDIIYTNMHNRSGSYYGTPPIIALLQSIQADMAGDANIARFMSTGGIIPGYIGVDEGLDPNAAKRLEEAFKRIQRAGGKELPIISGVGNTQFVPIAANSKEMETNQLQNYYKQKILAIYGVPPHVLGLTEGVNRGVAFAQTDSFMAGAINPFKIHLERLITSRIVEDFNHKLRFEFLEPNASDFQTRLQQGQEMRQTGAISREQFFFRLGTVPPAEETPAEISQNLDLEIKKMQVENLKVQLAQGEKNLQVMDFQIAQQQQQSEQMQMQQQQQQQQVQSQQQELNKQQQLQSNYSEGISPIDAVADFQRTQMFSAKHGEPQLPMNRESNDSSLIRKALSFVHPNMDTGKPDPRSVAGKSGVGLTPEGLRSRERLDSYIKPKMDLKLQQDLRKKGKPGEEITADKNAMKEALPPLESKIKTYGK